MYSIIIIAILCCIWYNIFVNHRPPEVPMGDTYMMCEPCQMICLFLHHNIIFDTI